MVAKKLLIIFGTRPEAIKLAPLVKRLQQEQSFDVQICVTAQHRSMLDQVLSLFNIHPDFDLDIMQAGQDLSEITNQILHKLKPVLSNVQPDLVLVHGDTTTAFAATLACYYQQIPVGHIEAGLRTGNLYSPYPEEANRRLISVLAQYHFAPTEQAKQNLLQEGIVPSYIWVTGNSVIDAIQLVLQKNSQNPPLAQQLAEKYHFLSPDKSLILVTGHRRENFGDGFERICHALATIALQQPDVQIVYPVHLNPQVQEPVQRLLGNIPNIFLLEPQDYLPFVYLMTQADIILTDSGGIQEEASVLNTPVLVLREMTERPEALQSGKVKLIGTQTKNIVAEVEQLLKAPRTYLSESVETPYGNGTAAQQIVAILKQQLGRKNECV